MALPVIKLRDDGRTAKFIRKPTAGDASRAYRMAGAKGNEIDRNAALLSLIVTVDGAAVPMEELLKLTLDDFGQINEILQLGRWNAPPEKEAGEPVDAGEADGGNFTDQPATP